MESQLDISAHWEPRATPTYCIHACQGRGGDSEGSFFKFSRPWARHTQGRLLQSVGPCHFSIRLLTWSDPLQLNSFSWKSHHLWEMCYLKSHYKKTKAIKSRNAINCDRCVLWLPLVFILPFLYCLSDSFQTPIITEGNHLIQRHPSSLVCLN